MRSSSSHDPKDKDEKVDIEGGSSQEHVASTLSDDPKQDV